MFKQEKGITLVSLVITIIVMLILAGVSLSMVMGEGSVLNQARDAVDTTELSSVKDEIGMAVGAAQTNFYAKYASTTGRISMQTALTELQLKEFTSAAAVSIYAPAIASGATEATGALVYELPNGNVYGCSLKITENSVITGEIKKLGVVGASSTFHSALDQTGVTKAEGETIKLIGTTAEGQ